jgi:hypothetical protein
MVVRQTETESLTLLNHLITRVHSSCCFEHPMHRCCCVLEPRKLQNSKPKLMAAALLLLLPLCAEAYSSQKKVLLSEIRVLTFYQDALTTGRRSSPRQQLECRSGCDSIFPEEMQCYNRKSFLYLFLSLCLSHSLDLSVHCRRI